MRTSSRLLLVFGVLATLVAASDVRAANQSVRRGQVVVSGNTLTSSDTLRPVNGRIYLGDVQVWPAVNTASTTAKPSSSAPEERCHNVTVNVRAQAAQMRRYSTSSRWTAPSYVAAFRQFTDAVDTAWVNPVSGLPWVRWKTGFSEEIEIDDLTDATAPTEDVATTIARVLNELREEGMTIYAGQDYLKVVPVVQASEFRRQLSLSVQGGAVGERNGRSFANRNSGLIRDLRNPVPLSNLRTVR